LGIILCLCIYGNSAKAQALSGNYTICSSGCSYSSISAAIDALNDNGISSAVTFTIVAGNYNENMYIDAVVGTSAKNTITFKGSGTGTRIYSTQSRVIEAYFASYFKFDNLTIQNTGSSSFISGVYMNSCSHFSFNNCKIIMPVTSSFGSYGIYNNYSQYITYTNNTIRGAYYGIYAYQVSTIYEYGNDVYTNNLIKRQGYCNIYCAGAYGNVYTSNSFDSLSLSFSYNIYTYYEGGATYTNNVFGREGATFNLANNYIQYYGANKPFKIINNFMSLKSTGYSNYSTFSFGVAGLGFQFKHNTLFSQSNRAAGDFQISSGDGLIIKSNNFYKSSGGLAANLAGLSSLDSLDGNNYYTNSASIIQYNNTVYSTLNDYKAAASSKGQGFRDNSVSCKFKSVFDLHYDLTTDAPSGVACGVLLDIDGNTRCAIFPTAGADESNIGKGKPTALFSTPTQVYEGSIATVFNSAKESEPKKYKWYINNVLVSDSIHLFTTALQYPSAVVKLEVTGCGGSDTYSKTINVDKPTVKPNSEFISDKNVINTDETILFTDLTTNGPNKWRWDISPEFTTDNGVKVKTYRYVFGDMNSPRAKVKFLYGGKYKVCLTTSNNQGTGVQLCKTDYVDVLPSINLGDQAVITESRGNLFDPGGEFGDYNFGTYSSVIDACADSVFLVINSKGFDLGCGYDYLRVYEGKDNTGKQLQPCKTNGSLGYGPGYTGGPSLGSCVNQCIPTGNSDTLVAAGTMYIELESNYAYNMAGFSAYFYTKPKTQTKPKAGFVSQDTACSSKFVTFTDTSTGKDIKSFWDLDDDGIYESKGKNIKWSYLVPNTYTVRMVAINCGGNDTVTKQIVILDPPKPVVGLMADNVNPTTTDAVYFSPIIKECVDQYEWKFTKVSGTGTVNYLNETTNFDEFPLVNFNDTGKWTVSLKATNTTGTATVVKVAYITVKDAYCKPTTSSKSTDIGISKVSINTISNSTTQGVNVYTDYTATVSTSLEQGVTYPTKVERNTANNTAIRDIYIDWNGDGDFSDNGENVATETKGTNKVWSLNITVPTTSRIGATVMRIAINQGNYTNKACGVNEYGEYEDYRLYITKDITKPVISLVASGKSDTMNMEQGQVFTDPGYSAVDNLDGIITIKVTVSSNPTFNPKIPGLYTFKYNVKDIAGNVAVTKTRIILVRADITAPNLKIEGTDTIRLAVRSSFSNPKVISALDLVDGDLSSLVAISGSVNASVIGTYRITYTVKDISSNSVTKYRTIIVIDTIAPTLRLIGKDTISVDVYQTYVDEGVSIIDNYYSANQLKLLVKVNNPLNVDKLGNYTQTYTLTDPSGNGPIQIERYIKVVDKTKPVVRLIGDTIVKVDVFTTFSDFGVSWFDNYDKSISKWDTSGTFYSTFKNGYANKLGSYTVLYNVRDASGNVGTVKRTIQVVDRVAPVITLNKQEDTVVCRWSTYLDAGYTLSDNFYPNNNVQVSVFGTYRSTQEPGLYTVQYRAVDASGNISFSAKRTIFVKQCISAIADVNVTESDIIVYPNPTDGHSTLRLAKATKLRGQSIKITDALGKDIQVISVANMGIDTYDIDLSQQPAGIYFVQLQTSNGIISKRVVKTK